MFHLRLPGSDGNLSHPYRIMIRLVADRPGIETSKLLLALEAIDDTPSEYVRILALADLDTPEIIARLGIGEANARNAVKILPGIAEQVGDISRHDKHTFLLSHKTSTEDSLIETGDEEFEKTQSSTSLPIPVDPAAISPLPNFGEATESVVDLAAAIEMRKRRTVAHHNTVISIAKLLGQSGYIIYERPYDCLESVQEHQEGLQSFLSMRRIEAKRKKASALTFRFSQSLASRRHRLSQAIVRSTIQRFGRTAKPLARSERLTISMSSWGRILPTAL